MDGQEKLLVSLQFLLLEKLKIETIFSEFIGTNYTSSVPVWTNYPYTSANYYVNATVSQTGLGACKSYIQRVNVNYQNIFQYELKGDENQAKLLLANYGPFVASICVTDAMFQYKSGIFYDPACPKATATLTQCQNRIRTHGEAFYETLNLKF